MCAFDRALFQRCIEESNRSEMIMQALFSDKFLYKLSESGLKIPKKKDFLSLIFAILGKKKCNFSDFF